MSYRSVMEQKFLLKDYLVYAFWLDGPNLDSSGYSDMDEAVNPNRHQIRPLVAYNLIR